MDGCSNRKRHMLNDVTTKMSFAPSPLVNTLFQLRTIERMRKQWKPCRPFSPSSVGPGYKGKSAYDINPDYG